MADDQFQKLIADEKELTRQGVVLDYVKRDVTLLNQKFDEFVAKIDTKYVLKEEFEGFKKGYEEALRLLVTKEEFKPCIEKVDSLNKSRTWVITVVMTAVLGAILSLVLLNTKWL
jgi:hypothetical protein